MFKKTVCAIFLIMIFIIPALCREYKIIEVKLIGLRSADEQTAYSKIQIRENQTYDRETLMYLSDESLKALYETGLFSDIKVDLSEAQRGYSVSFLVSEMPVLRKIDYKGVYEIEIEEFFKNIELEENQPLSKARLQQSIVNLHNFYKEKGYYQTEIEYKIIDAPDNKVDILFEVEEGSRYVITSYKLDFIEREGPIKDFWRRVKINWNLKVDKGDFYRKENMDEDMEYIANQFIMEGYHGIEIKPMLDFNHFEGKVAIKLIIYRNERFYVESIDVKGNTLASDNDLLSLVSMTKGDIFLHQKVMQDMNAITMYYGSRGYADASVEPLYEVDDDNKVILTFSVTEGEKYKFGRVFVRGNKHTNIKVITREVDVKEGAEYNQGAIARARRNLVNLGYFDNVNVQTRTSERDGQTKDVHITLEEGRTGQVSVGAAYSEYEKFMGTLDLKKSNFAFAPWHFTGRGQEANISVSASKRTKNFSIGWADPWFNDSLSKPDKPSPKVPIYLGLRAYNQIANYDGYDDRRIGGSVRVGRRFGFYNNAYITYQYERVKIDNIDSGAPSTIQEDGAKTDRTSGVTLEFIRSKLDNNWEPTKGYQLNLSNKIIGSIFGGNIDYNKFSSNLSFYYPLFWKMTLASNVDYSILSNPYSEAEPPSYEESFLGGATSVRGYLERSIGIYPPGATQAQGGRTALEYKIELRRSLYEDEITGRKFLGGVVFFDAGVLDRRSGPVNFSNFKYGVGFGLRVHAMQFPLSFDWGYKLNDTKPGANDKGTWLMHFNFGQSF